MNELLRKDKIFKFYKVALLFFEKSKNYQVKTYLTCILTYFIFRITNITHFMLYHPPSVTIHHQIIHIRCYKEIICGWLSWRSQSQRQYCQENNNKAEGQQVIITIIFIKSQQHLHNFVTNNQKNILLPTYLNDDSDNIMVISK